jgi:hypothetical protein
MASVGRWESEKRRRATRVGGRVREIKEGILAAVADLRAVQGGDWHRCEVRG